MWPFSSDKPKDGLRAAPSPQKTNATKMVQKIKTTKKKKDARMGDIMGQIRKNRGI